MTKWPAYKIRNAPDPVGSFGPASTPRNIDADQIDLPAIKSPALSPGLHVFDVFGDLWLVKTSRPTFLGFEMYLGRPAYFTGPAGPAIILTDDLVDQFERHRRNPAKLKEILPIGKTAVTRIRRVLGHHRYQDAELWWLERADDLMRMTIADFCVKHRVSSGAASQARQALSGPRQRPNNWWRSTESMDILHSKMPTAWIAERLGLAASTVRKYRTATP